jgi:hypothetical protein
MIAKKRKIDPNKPLRTVSSLNVTTVLFKDKIMGIIHDADADDGHFCTWNLDGERINIFPRRKGDSGNSDLVNFNNEETNERNK